MRNKKLTLIELIIVVLVLGLLVGLAIPQFTGVKANADVASFKNDIDVLTKAIDESYVKEDSLPLGEKVSIIDPALLDVIYGSGDSAANLYKVDLSKSSKYHSKLKSMVDADNYFIYSVETGKVFYTKGLVDGDSKTLYTFEYVGLTGVKLGTKPLINGMSVPVTEPVQTITGSIPVSSTVEVKVNGTDLPVTVEDVVFDSDMDLMASSRSVNIVAGKKNKTFTSEVLLLEGMNTITIKVDSQVTNFKINLGESSTPVTPEAPVIKPVAVISMTPEQGLTTATNITWSSENSTVAQGRTITNVEWEGKQGLFAIEGSYTVKLRVQDSTGVWSEWVEKSFGVISSDGIKEIAIGQFHTLALKEDGTLLATGYNGVGQLGTGDATNSFSFIQVQSNVKSITANFNQSLIIKEDGSLWATGENSDGQLGSGNSLDKFAFAQVQTGVRSVKAGYYHTVVIKDDNTLWATGKNNYGPLGTGNTISINTFTQVQTEVKDVEAGSYFSVILKEDGTLWATGINGSGELGLGDTVNRNAFTQIQTNVIKIVAGGYHILALKEDNTLWATGRNNYGQLGIGNTVDQYIFTQVQSGVKSMAAGRYFTQVLKVDNTLWATGDNGYGQLGAGNNTHRSVFVKVQTGVKSVYAGDFHTFAIKEDNTLWATGKGDFGQLGLSGNKFSFTQITY